jgi:starch-binding outer membrane protein, SusD/RagB family
MKNRIIYIAAIIFLLSAATGCKKVLDTAPQQSLPEINTFQQLQSQMRGAYLALKSSNYYDGASGTASAWSSLGDIMGDDFIEALESLGNWRALTEWRYPADDGAVTGAFDSAYTVIARANDVLRSTGKFETGSTADEAKQIKAQALALRANVHFDLLRYFGQSLKVDSDSLGVPYVVTIDPQNPFVLPTRNTVKDCYINIYKDLDEAITLFRAAGNPTSADKSIIDSTVLHCIRARVGLYCGNYADAVTSSTYVINTLPLASTTEWPLIWTDESLSEVAWVIPSDQTLTPGFPNNGNSAAYRVSNTITAIIFGPKGGIRSDQSAIRRNVSGISGFQRTLMYKYQGTKSFKVFRSAEMYLIRAEAKFRTGISTALQDLNDLREARDAETGTETGQGLFDAIMLERRIELIGEGHRWHDIKRTTRTVTRPECGINDGSLSSVCTVPSSSRSWIWPIPIKQINLNPNLLQNPGYN